MCPELYLRARQYHVSRIDKDKDELMIYVNYRTVILHIKNCIIVFNLCDVDRLVVIDVLCWCTDPVR
jgi:hypothetical protein